MSRREQAEHLQVGAFARLRCQDELDREARKRSHVILALAASALAIVVGVLG